MKSNKNSNIREQRARYDALLESLCQPSLEATRAFLAERRPADPEEGLTDDVIERLRARIDAAQRG